MKHKLESRLPGEVTINSDTQIPPPLRQKSEEELKNLLIRVKEESEQAGLKTQHKLRLWYIQFHQFKANRRGKSGNSDRLYFLGLQNHTRW